MSQVRMDSEDVVEIKSILGTIRYKTELIPKSVLMREIFEEVRKVEKLLPKEQAK